MIKVAAAFGGDNHLRTATFKRLSKKFFAVSMAVDIRRIKKRTSEIEGGGNGAERFVILCRTVAIAKLITANGPGAETDFRDF